MNEEEKEDHDDHHHDHDHSHDCHDHHKEHDHEHSMLILLLPNTDSLHALISLFLNPQGITILMIIRMTLVFLQSV